MPNLQARAMRREPTEPERLLWARLRDRRLGGHKFRRRHPIGAFVADFACLECRLIVEADGAQHVESEYDAYRSEWLRAQGWRVIRFRNNEVRENPNGVAEAILLVLRGEAASEQAVRGDPITLPRSGRGFLVPVFLCLGSPLKYPKHPAQKSRRQCR
jgi:very-short-patch-repair endonuclease